MPLLFEMARLAIERRQPAHLDALRALRDVIADERREREERFAAVREVLVLLSDMTGNRVWQMLARQTARLPALRADARGAPRAAARSRPHRRRSSIAASRPSTPAGPTTRSPRCAAASAAVGDTALAPASRRAPRRRRA